MSKIAVFVVLAFSVSVVFGASEFDATLTGEPPLLREGFVLRGVDGKLSGPDSNDVWFFEIASDVNDYRATLAAGTKLQLLPSSALEKMIADAKTRSDPTYRLWNGRVTKYKGRNFVFATFFLPLSPVKRPKPKIPVRPRPQKQIKQLKTPPAKKRELEPMARDPNDVLNIPLDILEKLRARRKEMGTRAPTVVDSERGPMGRPNPAGEGQEEREPEFYSNGVDSVFVDRTAFLVDCDDGGFAFEIDGLGRNVQQLSLRVLPCEALELAELKRSAELERVRFKIAAIMTKYGDRHYLLLQKATQTYSHANFGR